MEPKAMFPEPKPGTNSGENTKSVSAPWGSPAHVNDTDATALPSQGAVHSDTDPGLGTGLGLGSGTGTALGTGGGALSATSVSISDKIFGQYELMSEIARGGMGVVYKARQRGLDRLVALKMVLGFGGDQSAQQRFILEARSTASMDHPNVVPIYDSGEIDGKMYFTMALIEGPNLKKYVDDNGVPPIPVAVDLFAQIVSGVSHAHQKGIIHRDLKPANVLMDLDGRPRVTDFGLAKISSGSSELTGTGQIMGTPAYMPPEQARDSKEVGKPADVYSLGAILYFLLTGRPPFVGESIPDLLIKVVSENPAPPSTINAAVPPEVEEVCLKCLAKSPADRYADAKELAVALLAVVEQYVPRSTPSMGQIFGRTSGTVSTASLTRTGVASAGLSATSVSGAFPPADAPRKRGLKVALLSACGLLAAVALYLAVIRPPKKIEVAGPTPPVVPNNTQGVNEPPKVEPPAADAAFAWPTLAANDFNLKVELIANGPKDNQGVIQLPNKTVLKLKLKAEEDCRAAVYWIDPKGEITMLFPNRFDKDDHLKAGVERIIPGAAGDEYDLEATPTDGGAEHLRVVAEYLKVVGSAGTDQASSPAMPIGTGKDAYAKFTNAEEQAKVRSHVRGVILKAKKPSAATQPTSVPSMSVPKVAVAEIKFHVNP